MPRGLIVIDAPHFYAGLEHEGGVCVNAAPIIRYMVGWNGAKVAAYCAKKHWRWERVS